MDKNELNLKVEELKTAMHNRDFEKAVDIADTLELRKIKDNNFLSLVADAYELTHNYKKARKALQLAYENTNAGRNLAYRLCLVSIKCKEFDDAREYYEDFVELAPRDTSRYILKYKLAKAQGTSVEKLIDILEEYVNIDMDEKWAYELVKLYHMAGDEEKCVDMCDEISLWFAEGKYVVKAMGIKRMYRPLTPSQQLKYEKAQMKQLDDVEVTQTIPLVREGLAQTMGTEENVFGKSIEVEEIMLPETTDELEVLDELEELDKLDDSDEKLDETNIMVEPIKDINGVEDILRQLQARGILKAETVEQAVNIIDSAGKSIQEEENSEDELSTEEWTAEDELITEKLTSEDKFMDEKLISEDEMVDEKLSAEDELLDGKLTSGDSFTEELPVEEIKTISTMERWEADSIDEDVSAQVQEDSIGADNAQADETIETAETDGIEPDSTETDGIEPDRTEAEILGGMSEEDIEVPVLDLGADDLRSTHSLSAAIEVITGTDWSQLDSEENSDQVKISMDQSEEAVDMEQLMEMTSAEQIEEIADAEQIKEIADAEQIEEIADAEQIEGTTDRIANNETDGELSEAILTEKEVTEMARKKANKNNISAVEELETKLTLLEEEMAGFKNYCNVEGFEDNLKNILEKLIVDYNPNGKSERDNVVILGAGKSGKSNLAIEIIKLVNRKRGRRGRKLAKINGEAVNRKGFKTLVNKLMGSDLIIENAHELETETINEMVECCKSFTDDMMIILEGETENVQVMLYNHPRLSEMFNNIIEIKDYDIKEWVEYGIKYAQIQGYTVDEMAKLAFFKTIDDFFGTNKGISQSDVETIVEDAISKSKRIGRKISGIFSSKKDDEGLNILVESDFNI